MALDALADFEATPDEIAARYDRAALRAGFLAQMEPQTRDYAPPFTQDAVLDAMIDPRAVRMFVIEPYGEWQFAAAEGLPEDPGAAGSRSMGRILETGKGWDVTWQRLGGFEARATGRSDRPSNLYRFRREGLGWTLTGIDLTTRIR